MPIIVLILLMVVVGISFFAMLIGRMSGDFNFSLG